MALLSIIILALVQGVTEFLPVSSSGHLVLVHAVLNENAEPQAWAHALMMDVAVHVGTLISVLVYFREDLLKMLAGAKDIVTGDVQTADAKLNWNIVISSIPVILVGFVIHWLEPSWFRSVEIVAWMTLLYGVVLWVVDYKSQPYKIMSDMGVVDALLIGLAQALALVPGTSRSGITMIAGRALGYDRTDSARYSLLLAIVAITGAGTLAAKDLIESGNMTLTLEALLAVVISALSGWVSIAVMMRWLERFTFTPFAVYRVLLGGALLYALYSGMIA